GSRDHIDPNEFHQLGFTLTATPTAARSFAVGQVYDDTSAKAQGMQAGDAVVSIAGAPLDALTPSLANSLLFGNVGDMKVVALERAGQPIQLTILADDLLPPLN